MYITLVVMPTSVVIRCVYDWYYHVDLGGLNAYMTGIYSHVLTLVVSVCI